MFAVYLVHIGFLQAELISIYAHIFPLNRRLQVSLVELTYDFVYLYCNGPLADQDVHIQRAKLENNLVKVILSVCHIGRN